MYVCKKSSLLKNKINTRLLVRSVFFSSRFSDFLSVLAVFNDGTDTKWSDVKRDWELTNFVIFSTLSFFFYLRFTVKKCTKQEKWYRWLSDGLISIEALLKRRRQTKTLERYWKMCAHTWGVCCKRLKNTWFHRFINFKFYFWLRLCVVMLIAFRWLVVVRLW